jgi:hypothetical protein
MNADKVQIDFDEWELADTRGHQLGDLVIKYLDHQKLISHHFGVSPKALAGVLSKEWLHARVYSIRPTGKWAVRNVNGESEIFIEATIDVRAGKRAGECFTTVGKTTTHTFFISEVHWMVDDVVWVRRKEPKPVAFTYVNKCGCSE